MKRIKDFLYNWNDVIIVLVIILLAAGLIYWRMGVIMDYPKTLAANAGTSVVTTGGDSSSGGSSSTGGSTSSSSGTDSSSSASGSGSDSSSDSGSSSSEGGEPAGPQDGLIWKDGLLRNNMEVTIESGSASDAVDQLISAGLFLSYEEFANICYDLGYNPEDIQVGTFTFEQGWDQEDIVMTVMAY